MKASRIAAMDSAVLDNLVRLKITRQLYQHAAAAIFATIMNAIIVVLVFRDTVAWSYSLGWAGICVLYLLWRLYFTRTVLKKKLTLENYVRRHAQFAITICISGILFGSAGILFLAPGRPAYNAFIFFLMGGMFAGSMGAFAIDSMVFVLFSAPVMLPVTIHSFLMGGELNTAMAVMGLIFMAMMAIVVRRMNATMVDAFRLGIQNKLLARNTKKLNHKLILANKNLKRLSLYDSLTNIHNRRFVFDVVRNEVNRFGYTYGRIPVAAEEAATVYGIFMIDIDHFKQVNDGYGHACGDQFLIQFAAILKSLVRKDDVLSRWGGEEFLVVLKRTSPEYLGEFAAKVISAVAATSFRLNDSTTIRKTCSLGYASFPFLQSYPKALSLEQVIDLADKALYFAKNHGRNRVAKAEYLNSGSIPPREDLASVVMQDIDAAIARGEVIIA